MGRCFRSFFTKSPTTQNHKITNNHKLKWITTLLKSCKDNNNNNRALAPTAITSSTQRRENNHERSETAGYAIVDDYSNAKAVVDASNTAAKAAVVAAHAVVEVVRIATSRRFNFDSSRQAAVRIQSVFRGYLARKALRALRALVRLQALVRGYIVRKQAVDQVRRMHALIRAQARARAIRAPVPASSNSSSRTTRSCILDPPTPEDSEHTVKVWKSLPDKIKLGSGRAYSRHFDERNIDKIVEVDSYARPYDSTKSKSLFVLPDYSSHNSYQTPAVRYPSEDLYLQYSSEIDRYSYYTADNIPPFHAGSFRSISARRGGHIGPRDAENPDHPNYMAYTKSSKAKMRSVSAPKQRTQLERSTSQKCYSSYHYGSRRLSTPVAS